MTELKNIDNFIRYVGNRPRVYMEKPTCARVDTMLYGFLLGNNQQECFDSYTAFHHWLSNECHDRFGMPVRRPWYFYIDKMFPDNDDALRAFANLWFLFRQNGRIKGVRLKSLTKRFDPFTDATEETLLISEKDHKYDAPRWLCLHKDASSVEQMDGDFVANLDGTKIKDQLTLFQEIALTMKFPDYFGKNWNALDECLADLEWIPSPSYIVIWQNASNLLLKSPDDFLVFLDVFRNASEFWRQSNIRMELHIVDEKISSINNILKEAVFF